jgi:hypothetical protein
VFWGICFVPLTGNLNYSKKLFVTRKNSPKGLAALIRYNIKATGFAGGYLLGCRLRGVAMQTGAG